MKTRTAGNEFETSGYTDGLGVLLSRVLELWRRESASRLGSSVADDGYTCQATVTSINVFDVPCLNFETAMANNQTHTTLSLSCLNE